MPTRLRIPLEVQDRVRIRANNLCEYCHVDERWQYVRFTIDHVLPVSLGGDDSPENLALACFHCNRRKSNRVTAVVRQTENSIGIFNPRSGHWADHFIWSSDGARIIPLTVCGQATSNLLEFNRERILLIRASDIVARRHPPTGDPIQS